jgi:putative RNA 2'-phosphotransferase
VETHQIVKFSKLLSRALRHDPRLLGLQLDSQGWADVDALLVGVNARGFVFTFDLLREVVEKNDKKRFSFSEDEKKIRANQGHSINIDLGLEPVTPPEILYHGTASQFIESIRCSGLSPRKRRHVHLSPDEQTAQSVGRRHGEPIVLAIRAGEMQARGHAFYLSANHVWLTKSVPPQYIIFPP